MSTFDPLKYIVLAQRSRAAIAESERLLALSNKYREELRVMHQNLVTLIDELNAQDLQPKGKKT